MTPVKNIKKKKDHIQFVYLVSHGFLQNQLFDKIRFQIYRLNVDTNKALLKHSVVNILY